MVDKYMYVLNMLFSKNKGIGIILSKQRIPKALIRLRKCAG